jgi:hypothetical protein
LKFTRQRFQRGTLRKVARADKQWAWEYRYQDPTTNTRKSMFLSIEKFPTQVAVERHLEAFVLKLNSENPTLAILEPTFNAILDRFIEEERLLEIKQQRPGDRCDAEGSLSYSTAVSYLSVIKQVRVKWGTTHITRMKPVKVQEWLKNMDSAPKTLVCRQFGSNRRVTNVSWGKIANALTELIVTYGKPTSVGTNRGLPSYGSECRHCPSLNGRWLGRECFRSELWG